MCVNIYRLHIIYIKYIYTHTHIYIYSKLYIYSFPSGSVAKNLPVMQETWVQFLVGEDPPEEEMATQSSISAWKIPWTEEPGGL